MQKLQTHTPAFIFYNGTGLESTTAILPDYKTDAM